jgi:hypothetical protein
MYLHNSVGKYYEYEVQDQARDLTMLRTSLREPIHTSRPPLPRISVRLVI